MFAWFAENIGNIVIIIVLIVIVSLIIVKLIKDKKNGKTTCGGNCSQCGACCGGAQCKKTQKTQT